MKILAVVGQNNYLQKKLYTYESIEWVDAYFNANNLFTRMIRRACLESKYVNAPLSAAIRSKNIQDYDFILVNELTMPEKILTYLRAQNPKAKIVYILWNTIQYIGTVRGKDPRKEFEKLLMLSRNLSVNIVSFDRQDCEKYNLIFNDQFSYYIPGDNDDDEKSIFFCGKDKGRLSKLSKFAGYLDEEQIPYVFWVVPDKQKNYFCKNSSIKMVKFIPLERVIAETKKHRIIFDLIQDKQHGLSWRALDALFYHKKLITNFKEIKEYDFYRPENIFILGEDHGFRKWLQLPLVNISSDIIGKYTFRGWFSALRNKIDDN